MQTFSIIVGLVALVAAAIAFCAWLFMLVWNFVMPAVFNLPELSFWYALAIIFLLGFVGSWFKSSK